MITEKGRQILSKYVLGVNPAFATHIAIGCGADSYPTSTDEPDTNYYRENLEFETTRIPIISRGLIKEDGIDKMVFKAELPIESRYGITEIGLFSEQRNVRASQFDSKTISEFNGPIELWYKIKGSDALGPLDIINSSLANQQTFNLEPVSDTGPIPICFAYTNNKIWSDSPLRQARKEQPRFGIGSIVMRGNYSDLFYNTATSTWSGTNLYGIETSTIGINLVKNSPDDEIRIAFSIASTVEGSTNIENLNALVADTTIEDHRINIWLEFVNNVNNNSTKYAKAKVSIDSSVTNTTDYSQSPSVPDGKRYIVHSFKKSDFIAESGFSWAAINGIRIFASIQGASTTTDQYWLIFDGIRLENVSTPSPTYGLVAYTEVFSDDELPAIKNENTKNFVEFRMAIE